MGANYTKAASKTSHIEKVREKIQNSILSIFFYRFFSKDFESWNSQGGFKQGDHIGCYLNLDEGWLRFYRNGTQHGPGYTNVTGPVVPAVVIGREGISVQIVPEAQCPEELG